MDDKKDVELLLLEIEAACELVESGEMTFEKLGKVFYEYLSEPITHALNYKLSDKLSSEED